MSTTIGVAATRPRPEQWKARQGISFTFAHAATGQETPLRGLLRWIGREPVMVEIIIRAPHGTVRWFVSCDLLTAGLAGPAGLGDVSILPDLNDPAARELLLSSPHGRACLRFDAGVLAAFLMRIDRMTTQMTRDGSR